ncbi:MAG: NAD-dependent epimerase/dehydratase family protein, partial [Verrucomicrobiales bacterium]|nr:NAD-dependent epimerase/dehydratase family protein [Verrucomicrobiales bacterium]
MILIAGVGYIGAALAEKLRSDQHPVITANRNRLPRFSQSLDFECDISDPASVARLRAAMPRPPDTIINCASSGRGGADAYRKVYLEGTRNLLENFPGARLVFTSSTSVYAQTDGSQVDEKSATQPPRETGQILLDPEHLTTRSGGTVARLGG